MSIKNFKVVPVTSTEDFARLGSEWDELLMQSRANTIFLTWEWLYTWTEVFCQEERTLFCLTIYHKDKLIGVAPWYIRSDRTFFGTLRSIEFLGSPEMGSDYLDVIIKKGQEKPATKCIYNFLFGETKELWDQLALNEIPSESLFLLYLLENIKEDGKYVRLSEASYCPVAVLPQTWNEFLKQLSRRRREQFSRHFRLLKKHGEVKHEIVAYGDEDQGNALERLFGLYRLRWGKNRDQPFFEHLRKFMDRCKERSWIQVDLLTINGKDIAGLLHYKYQGTSLMYLMAVDRGFDEKISIGNILVGLCLEESVSQGIDLYDFLKGTEEYKFHWANGGRRSIKVELPQRRIKMLAYLSFAMVKDLARIFLR